MSANYGAMLYEEAKREQEKRELWRQRQLALRAEADVECTFQPQLGPSVKQFGAGEDEDFAERFERMQAERCAKRLELEKEVRAEEERECTFRPVAKNKNSERITAGYGDCLDEMRARERMREERSEGLGTAGRLSGSPQRLRPHSPFRPFRPCNHPHPSPFVHAPHLTPPSAARVAVAALRSQVEQEVLSGTPLLLPHGARLAPAA